MDHVPVSRRRLLVTAATLPAAVALAPSVPRAEATGGAHGGTTVRVVVSATAVTMTPATVPAGVVHFQISTGEDNPMAPGLLRLARGVSTETYLAHYALANSTDPEVRKNGVRLIDREARYLGDATVTAVSPIRFSTVLAPGRYHVFNYMAVLSPNVADSVRPLRVTGWRGPRVLPCSDSVITLTGTSTRSRYVAPDVLPARGSVFVTNRTTQTNEAMFLRLVPEATEHDVREFWAAAQQGQWPPKNILLSQPEGIAPLSPGHSGLLGVDLPPGKYLVTSFMYDRQTWVKGVFQGFWKIVQLR